MLQSINKILTLEGDLEGRDWYTVLVVIECSNDDEAELSPGIIITLLGRGSSDDLCDDIGAHLLVLPAAGPAAVVVVILHDIETGRVKGDRSSCLRRRLRNRLLVLVQRRKDSL